MAPSKSRTGAVVIGIVAALSLILVVFALKKPADSFTVENTAVNTAPSSPSSSSSSSAQGSNKPSSNSADEKPQSRRDSSSNQSGSHAAAACKPQRRYEPTPFPRGTDFRGKTPLQMIKDGEAVRPALPRDWDGGYGWVFTKYISSTWEARWKTAVKPLDGKPGSPLCELLRGTFKSEFDAYMGATARMPPNDGGKQQCDLSAKMNAAAESGNDFTFQNLFADEPLAFDPEIFSRFEYTYKCTQPPCKTAPPANGPKVDSVKYTFIEPLVGLLRYPNACFDSRFQESIVNKNYMILDPWSLVNPSRSTISPDPRILYFDGGASTWDAGAGGASQSWFHRVYDAICIRFQNFFMWEVGGHDPKGVFKLIPGHLKPGYRWFNIPLAIEANSWDNPMNHILLEAKKEDIVIVKIDFDTPHLELGLIQAIVDHVQLSDLIDELFFEHHVNHEILRGYWGTGHLKVYHSDSIALFSAMREKGVRAHSWV